MAIYKQVPKQDPTLDHVYLKIADIYRKMGFTGDAFAQYRILVQHYDGQGNKDKALEVLSIMADMDPRKTDLKEKIKIAKSQVDAREIPGAGATVGGGPVPGELTPFSTELPGWKRRRRTSSTWGPCWNPRKRPRGPV